MSIVEKLRSKIIHVPKLVTVQFLSEDITKCLDTYCNTNLYVSTTVFITQGNMWATCFD